MMTDTIPDGLPTLSRGSHRAGEGRACVMEYVSVLAGERWSSCPACTHPLLASAARYVNDHVGDSQRHQLVPLIGRLFGTADPGGCSEFALETALRPHFDRLHRWRPSSPDTLIARLVDILDEFDRLTGRAESREVTVDELRELAAAVAS